LAEVIRPRVLIVDDDPLNRSLLRRVLGTNYSVIEAESGSRALALVASDDPDVVLLDVMMPGMSGYEVCRRIKARPDTRPLADIPLIGTPDQVTETLLAIVARGARRLTVNFADVPRPEGTWLFAATVLPRLREA